jgi:uncharacterized protein (UPF0147 family)
MATMLELAQLVVASWIIANEGEKEIPSADGVFDLALNKASADPAFPDWGRTMLHFVPSRFGLQCLEVETLFSVAGKAKLTNDPNPLYVRTEVATTPRVARWLLSRLDVSKEDAARIGIALRAGVQEAEQKQAAATI